MESIRLDLTPPESQTPLLPIRPRLPEPWRSRHLARRILANTTRQQGRAAQVREATILQLEELRAIWARSCAVMAICLFLNFIFLCVSIVVLLLNNDETPSTPMRIWIGGYIILCMVHIYLVCEKYSRNSSDRSEDQIEDRVVSAETSILTDLAGLLQWWATIYNLAYYLWWTTGAYWVISGGQELIESAPNLYWCSCLLLAWDCICVVSFIAVICSVFVSFAWCLPSFYDIMYLVTTEDDVALERNIINRLAKYRYTEASTSTTGGTGTMIPIPCSQTGTMTSKRVILHEDAECCICLAAYKEGAVLHALPCKHHFHSGCIIKWLRIKAICPLCNFKIQAIGNYRG